MDAPLWVWGLAGGAGAELLQWFRVRDQLHAGMPDWAKSGSWVVTTLMVACGAGVVLMYQSSGVELNSVLAVNIGASAPLIISSLSSQVPPLTRVD